MPPGTGGGVFPLPRSALLRAVRPSSRRGRVRAKRAAFTTSLADNAITALNHLHSSFSSLSPASRNHVKVPSPVCISRAVTNVNTLAATFVSRLTPAPQGGPRGDAFAVPDASRLPSAFASLLASSDALPVDADLVALPGDMQRVNLLDALPPHLRQIYTQPSPELFADISELDDNTKPRFATLAKTKTDYTRLVRRMHAIGMLRFLKKVKVVNGYFAIAKPDGTQRLLVDCRPANRIFAPSPSMELPCPDVLAGLMAESDEPVYVAKADLDNCYHRFAAPEWVHPYLALPAVRASDVGLEGEFGADTMIFPCCTTLPMGWSHSAFLCQSAHEHFIYQHTPMRPEDAIRKSNDRRLNRPRHGVYIDDFWIMSTDRALCTRYHDAYLSAVATAGHVPKWSKVFPPSAEGVECIGMLVHGRLHTVGAHPDKLMDLANRTEVRLSQGLATGLDMQRLVGAWSWVFLVRRPSFSVFSAVYRFIETAGGKRFNIWPSVANELKVAIGLIVLLSASWRCPWFPSVSATDASTTGLGVMAARVPAPVQTTMSHHVLPVEGEVPTALPTSLVGVVWSEIVACPWRTPEHINILEIRAVETALRWVLSHPTSVGTRFLVWTDSLVTAFAIRKGRSSSPHLLRRLRALAAWQLAFDCRVYANYINTAVNPADEPSRRFQRPNSPPGQQLGKQFSSNSLGDGPSTSGFLARAAHMPVTRAKYIKAVRSFAIYMQQEGFSPVSFSDLDDALSSFLEDHYLQNEGKGRSQGAATMSGLHMLLPACRGQLGRAALALKGWLRLVPSVSHPPLTWALAVTIATKMMVNGFRAQGIATLLAFDCYLRVGELTNLRRADVATVGDARLGPQFSGTALRLRSTKTGPNQWVSLGRPVVRALLLKHAAATTDPESKIFNFSADSYRRVFKAACSQLGLSRTYVPHSLRHGGATHDHLAGVSVEDILLRGRWASTKSARHYIQSGRAVLLSLSAPPAITALAAILVPHVFRIFTVFTVR